MKYLTLIICILLLIRCSSEKNPAIVTIDVQSPTGPELKYLSEIATDIQYIPLETRPEALMRFVNYFKATDDKFYINTLGELLCFNKSGKYLYKLSQRGRGPNEYEYLVDYDVNPEKNSVVVLTGVKLFFYDETVKGFEFSRQLALDTRPSYCDLIPGQNNILLSFTASSGENIYQCVCISPEGDTVFKRPNFYRFIRNSRIRVGFSTENVINRIDDNLRIKGILSDTLFTITGDYKVIPYLILNTEGNSISTDFLANIPESELGSGGFMSKYLMISEILETSRYLFYRYSYQKSSYWGVYDKNSRENHRFPYQELLKDDISGGINIDPKFTGNGVIYSWVDALTFKNYMSENMQETKELKKPERAEELKRLAETIKEDDNHILIKITPRK